MSKKLLVLSLAVAFALSFGVAKAQAGGPQQGPKAIVEDEIEVEVSNFNMGHVNNIVLTGSNTGLNMQMAPIVLKNRHHHHTQPVVSSDTGDAMALADVGTGLNSSVTGVSISDFENGPVAANTSSSHRHHQNGAKGLAVAEDEIDVEVKNMNIGGVSNFVLTIANSGLNLSGNGISNTGDALALGKVTTNLNKNLTSVEVKTDGSGPLALNQSRNGGVAIAKDETEVEVNNFNLGHVTNLVGTVANTGLNVSGNGTSSTGNALAATSVASNVNTNTTGVSVTDNSAGPVAANVSGHEVSQTGGTGGSCVPSVCGSTSGAPTAVNSGTSGTAVVSSETEVEVSNANVGTVTNLVGTVANTGANVSGESTSNVASVGHHQTQPAANTSSTGDAVAATSVTNTVNSNTTSVVIVK